MKQLDPVKKIERNILKLTDGAETDIRAFEYNSLQKNGSLFFQTPTLGSKAVGSNAAGSNSAGNDEAPTPKERKDRLFRVDPILQGLLSVDEQQDRLVEERVNDEVTSIRETVAAEAFSVGHAEGFQAGETEAKKAFETKAFEALAKLDHLVNEFEGLRGQMVHANDAFIMELVFRVSKEILKHELATDPEYLKRLIHQIVEEVGTRDQIKILVHADRLAQVLALRPELEKKYASLKSLSIESSTVLDPDDCIVETDFSRVDASWGTQLENLHRALQHKEPGAR